MLQPFPVRLATLVTLVVAALAAMGSTTAGSRIEWSASVDAAFAVAKPDNRPVFVAINMDGERANDEAVKTLYSDPVIVKLAERCVSLFASRFDHAGDRACPRAGVVSCADHIAVEKEIRKRYLEKQGTQVVAPQHLWLAPDGTILLSVPYRVTEGELEWCFVTALKRVDASFEWTLSASARAPKRLVTGGVSGADEPLAGAAPPTVKELEQLIDELKKDSRPWESLDKLYRILLSGDKQAIDYVRSLLTSGGGGGRGGRGGGGGGAGGGPRGQWKANLVHAIGRFSPVEYWEIVVPLLADPDLTLRRETAVALEQLAAAKALGELQKRLKKEEEVDAQKELIRAIASCGRDGKGIKQVAQVARKDADEVVRANAFVGAAYFEDRDAFIELARSGLLDPIAAVRAAAAYSVAIRRETALRQLIEEVIAGETDVSLKDALEASLRVLDGAPATELDSLLRDYARSDIARDRVQ